MAYCEDYPCCGHESGDCPDAESRFSCVECGIRLSKHASSSICATCQRAMARQYDSMDDGCYRDGDY